MIHGLLEFVREQRTRRQRLTRPQAGRSPATTSSQPKRHLSQPQCRTWRRWPQHLLQHCPSCCPTEHTCPLPAPVTTPVGLLCSTPSTRGRNVAHEESQRAQVAVGSKRHLGPSRLTIKAGPFRAESLPTRQHHQSPSSIRHGIKMGHTPYARHGYGNAPLPQPYKVQMRGQAWSSITPPQLLASGPTSRGHPTQTHGGGPQNTALPKEEGCC